MKKEKGMIKIENHAALPGGMYHGTEYEPLMVNGIIGTHLATDTPVTLPLNYKEMQLALGSGGTEEVQGNVNELWDLMCNAVLERTGIEIIGQIEIDYIVVNGVKRTFH